MKAEAIAELQSELPGEAATSSGNGQHNTTDEIEILRRLDLRYHGLDASLTIDEPSDGDYLAAFIAEHRKQFGYVQPNRNIEIAAARVEAVWQNRQRLASTGRVAAEHEGTPAARQIVEAYFAGKARQTSVFDREQLNTGQRVVGPAIIHERASTTVIDPGWCGEVLSQGEILVERCEGETAGSRETDSDTAYDPARLEIFNNHFAAIAEQMGITLRKTARSVNVKERLDFSCAIFDPRGQLVVNAPHIPVHLGAMAETVRRIMADNPDMGPGDVFVTNDPYRGGSHLPDITVITPVYSSGNFGSPLSGAGDELLFFTANRAHHAEIGGISPGSMPPCSKNLAEEGVLIRNFKLIDHGDERFDALRLLLLSPPHPSRAVDDNLEDIAAQVAANHQGARDLRALIDRHSLPVVQAYMQHIHSAAEVRIRRALAKLPPERREFVDYLDDGSPIRVAITIHSVPERNIEQRQPDLITVDFSGTGPVHPGNLNANRAIVTAAIMYVLRLLVDEDIPLNEGILAPVKLILPECLLNPPPHESPAECAAVAGGNVETSQRVVDVLLGALGLAAASQGTMNNLLFGNEAFGYYETICGGAGATAQSPGADAVHTHMTNTRITDPEVLEKRFPVRIREFSIRHHSGGTGRNRGGNGVTRTLEFLQALNVSILSQRRNRHFPNGMSGGSPGSPGRNTLIRLNGPAEIIGAIAALQVNPGDILTIETPGGGGWGKSTSPGGN